MAAAKIPGCHLGHVEAGLRSYDRKMPEETNRVVTDHMSTHLFAVTNTQKEILLAEGIPESRIHVVGNTVVDALFTNINIAKEKSTILSDNGLYTKGYFLVTAHRSSNVDTEHDLKELFELLFSVLENYKEDIIWPVHPRTRKNIEKFGISIPRRLKLIEPIGYLDFLHLQASAKAILTDSGGIQEEACCLQVPCITLRENTERPETLDVGANFLVGRDKEKCLKALDYFFTKCPSWTNPFGDGNTAKMILDIMTKD